MTEQLEPRVTKEVPLASNAALQSTTADRYASGYVADARNALFEEILFAGNEFLDRTITEAHLFNEFLSKIAEAHSLRDYSAMYQACSRHQLDFVRRDTERLLKHSERVIDNTSKLVESWRRN